MWRPQALQPGLNWGYSNGDDGWIFTARRIHRESIEEDEAAIRKHEKEELEKDMKEKREEAKKDKENVEKNEAKK